MKRRTWPWVAAGLLLGGLLALGLYAPASWLAARVAEASGERLLLADARGSIWSGSAVAVLGGGPGSRDASALPGRLHWDLGLAGASALELRLRQDCCLEPGLRLRIEPGFGRLRLALPPQRAAIGRWPAAWLTGLGLPFNAVRPGGLLQLSGEALALETVQGRWRLAGKAELVLLDLSSALAPLDTLGSYRVDLSGSGSDVSAGAGAGQDGARISLQTLRGPLQLSGSGQWAGPRLRFRGEARAETGSEAMLNNLLNLLGQRRGAVAVLAIG